MCVFDLSDQVDRGLVIGHVPELNAFQETAVSCCDTRNRYATCSSPHHRRRSKTRHPGPKQSRWCKGLRQRTPSCSNLQGIALRPRHLRGDQTSKSGLELAEQRVSQCRLTIHSIVHDKPTGISDSFSFMRIAALVVVRQSDGLATSTAEHKQV